MPDPSTKDGEPPSRRYRLWAWLDPVFRTRWHILAIWMAIWTTCYLIGRTFYERAEDLGNFTTTYWIAVGILSALQAIFVLPVARPRPKAERGKSLVLTLVLAAFLAAAMLGGLAAAIWHVLQADVKAADFIFVALGVFGMSWVTGTVLLVRFVRSDRASSREEIVTRIAHGLFVGTVVDALLTIPIDLMMRERESCFCGTGPFLSYVVGGTVGIIVIGPAMVLPVILRRHRSRYHHHCDVCGSPLVEYGIGSDFRTNAGPLGCSICGMLSPGAASVASRIESKPRAGAASK